MSVVSSIYAKKQIESADLIANKRALRDIVGLTPERLADPTAMVPIEDYFLLLETIAESEFPDLRFHMKTCQSMRCDEFGLFGFAFKSAPTLRHGFRRIWRYITLHNQVSLFSAEDLGNDFCWSMQAPAVNRLGSHLSNEAAMATTLTLCRETTHPDLRPKKVQFAHERAGSIDAVVAHFGQVPEFGAPADAMVFDREQVDQPCNVGDEAIWNYMLSHLDQSLASTQAQDKGFEEEVIEEIAKLLSGGVPQLSEVSQNLGLSIRTLQRRLNDRGKTFQVLVDEARQKLALNLVATSVYSLAEVAFLTGFSEQSAFSRAFKRWSGETPRSYRIAHQQRTDAMGG